MATPRYFSTYLQFTRTNSVRTERRQLLILPPMRSREMRAEADAAGQVLTDEQARQFSRYYTVWHRTQFSLDNRSIWRHSEYKLANVKTWMSEEIESRTLALDEHNAFGSPWAMSPVITVEVPASRMYQVLREGKTPYWVVDRVKKVARSRHDLDIS